MLRKPAVVCLIVLVPLSGCISGGDDTPGGDAGDGPLAAFAVAPGADAATFVFDASASRGRDLAYAWDFGDGANGTGKRVEHTYTFSNAIVGARLVVTDADGATDEAVQGLVLGSGENAAPVVALDLSTDWVSTGRPMTARATATDADGDAATVRIGTAFLGTSAPPGLLPAAGGGHDHGSAEYAPAANGFDSPRFESGESYSVELSATGLYDYHCHPHPWMTGTVVVMDDPALPGGDVPLAAWAVKGWVPQTVFVRPGANLTWANPDPVFHTITLSRYVPIQRFAATTDGQATLMMDREGVYSVVALATDAKGATGYTWSLVRASRTVPSRVVDLNFTNEIPAPASEPTTHAFRTEYAGNGTVGFTWTSQSPAEVSAMRLDLFAGASTAGSPMATSHGEPIVVRLAAGTYTVQVTNEQAVLASYTAHVRVELEVKPDFGSAPASDGHGHDH